ncbi:MAG: ABC-F family ATP-binding cassette domain-containing protein [Flavobacteriales bacterium]|nr:ABC-F family ATP-binding cassette domain-containing protein [Flavobacteriales bacterium]
MSQTNVLSVENLGKRYGERLLFDGVTFGLGMGQKAALVARNGAGKSTLLRAICGLEPPDEGRISFASGKRWAFLHQDPAFDTEATIMDQLYAGDNQAVKALHSYASALESGAEGDDLQLAYDAMDQSGGWDFEARAKEVLGRLNIHDLSRNLGSLSGGERRRIALAKVLIEEPDILFLDEPTNHLDLEMIQWLEKHLAQAKMTLLMVTHDRYFLEHVCEIIIELDNEQLYRYKGNYSYFLEKKSERQDNAVAVRDKAKRTMRRELDWMRSTPSARTGKSKSRIDRFYELKTKARVSLEEDPFHIALNPHRLGGKIIELHKVSQGFGDRILFEGLTHHFKRNERIGIVGSNGSGKSSLLDLIVQEAAPKTGKVSVGETVVFGHFSQHGASFPDGLRVIEAVREIAEFMPLKGGQKLTAAQLLERFLFPRNTHHQQIGLLSGGERKRLHMLQVIMRNPNFLILDEPTNDLDIFTLQVLEEFLLDFPGCLIVVSHDRYFMDRLVEHIWVLGEDGSSIVRDYPGNYTQYRLARAEQVAQERDKKELVKKETSQVARNDYSQRLTYKEKFEFEKLEGKISTLEKQKVEAELALANATGHEQLSSISSELGEVTEALDAAELRWLELSEKKPQ